VILMPFDQSSISFVAVHRDGADLLIAWTSSAPEGTTFQVYNNQRLVWFGTSRQCHVPGSGRSGAQNIWVDVGAVDDGDTHHNYSESLASLERGGSVLTLSWSGGTYLDASGRDDIQGFHVYASGQPGGAVDLTNPVATVPAYPGGWISDGYGLGGFGQGGFGRSANSYVWKTTGLATGTWQFQIIPYDRSGTERGVGQTVSVDVSAAPLPPARGGNGGRMTYSYSGTATRNLMLLWSASPSAS
jgi:hypothetical protein